MSDRERCKYCNKGIVQTRHITCNPDIYQVHCSKCGVTTRAYNNEDMAQRAWDKDDVLKIVPIEGGYVIGTIDEIVGLEE